MGRRKRLYYANAVYHVSIRGNNKQPILKEEKDKIEFLKTLSKYKERFKFRLFGFVLMDNHVHLVIEAGPTISISRIMQSITLSYSQKFRHAYQYTGYVWQGRFKSNVIEDDSYILACLDYIHHNPVRANMVDYVEEYTWSSYRFYNGTINTRIDRLIKIDKTSF